MKIINLIDEINRSEWLVRFYEELLLPNFSQFPDELDSLDTFYYALNSKSIYPYTLHITLIIEDNKILAGASYEYYPKSESCLLTYIVVSDFAKGKGLSKILMSEIQNQLEFHYKELKALFAESNSDKVSESEDVMNPKLRRQILNRLGFQYLDFDYIQPPLTKNSNKCRDLMLAIHKDYVTSKKVKSLIILDWLSEFWSSLCGDGYVNDLDWFETQEKLDTKRFINVINNI
jgi:N-acetylglutamate synthase-like GNAT family acetyltransferase